MTVTGRQDSRAAGPSSYGPTRVLHVVSHLGAGGLEKLVADIVHALDGRRFESHVLCLSYAGHQADRVAEVAGLHLVEDQGPLSMLWPRAIIRIIRDISPHVVHIHSGVWYKASLAADAAGVRGVIYTEHGREPEEGRLDRLLDRLAALRTDKVIAVSRSVERILRAMGCEREQVQLIRNGVDTDEYRPCPDDGRLRRELGLDEETPVICSTGRLTYVKGYDVMVRSLARLDSRSPNGRPPVLVVAAEGEQRDALEELAAELSVRNRVYLLGWRDSVVDLYRAAALFTLSSRSEGTSLALLEAMSSGLCPVVTDVGGNPEVLGDDLAHRLVPAESPDALAGAWDEALREPDARLRDGRTARNRVKSRYSLDAMVDAYADLYQSLGTGPEA